MADLITFHRGSDNLAKPVRLNLHDKDSLNKSGQTSEKSTVLCNEDSRSRVDGAGDDKSSLIFKTSILKSKQKKVISMSSISRLSTPRSYKSNSNPPDLTKVKISALLYEITERTNQLAQSRSRITEAEVSQKTLKSRGPKSMSRIIELACPKVIHDSAPKPINFVSPSSLKAIATQRIIELSQPRKDRRFKLPRRKTQIHRSCNLRIRGFSKLKQRNHSRVKAKLLDPPEENKLDMTKLIQGSLCSTLDVGRDAKRTRRRFKRKDKRVPEEMRKQQESSPHRLNNTNSDRSVVIVGLDWEKRPRFSLTRESRGSRRKSSRMTKGTH